MQLNILLYGYLIVILSLIVISWMIKAMCSKVVFKPEKAFPSKQEFMRTHIKQFNIIARIGGTIFITIALWLIIIPAVIDLPMLIKGEYCLAYGETVYSSTNRVGIIMERDVRFLTFDGEILDVRAFSSGYKKGEKYVIHYFPHMKIACIHKIS